MLIEAYLGIKVNCGDKLQNISSCSSSNMVSVGRMLFVLAITSGAILEKNLEESPYYAKLGNDVYLWWRFNRRLITFTVIAPTTGWVALGMSTSGSMKGADLTFMWVANGSATALDMHAEANTLPTLDTKQNIFYVRGTENATHTKMIFKRYLDTCDKLHDTKITDDTMRVLYSYGRIDPSGSVPTWYDYHGSDRGSKSLRLTDPRLISPAKKDISHSLQFFETQTFNFTIPKKDTFYKCSFHKFPELDSKHHIVELRPLITSGNEKLVHHMVLKICDKSFIATENMLSKSTDCLDQDLTSFAWGCLTHVIAWAVGMGNFVFPRHIGYPIEGTSTIFKMEIHYDNKDLIEGVIDSSGFEIIYTPKLHKYDAGNLMVGHDVWPTLIVPPQLKNFVVQGHCPNECYNTSLVESGLDHISVFAVMLHSHTAGSGMVLKHYRDGKELRPVAKDFTYDFDYQETILLSKEIDIHRQDNLVMECRYDTSLRLKTTFGGYATWNEMCLAFVLYYPPINLTFCGSAPSQTDLTEYLGLNPWSIFFEKAKFKEKEWTEKEVEDFNKAQLTRKIHHSCTNGSQLQFPIFEEHDVPTFKKEYVEEPGRCDKVAKNQVH